MKCLVCPNEAAGKAMFCSPRCRKVHSRGGLKNPNETQRRRAASERRKAARERFRSPAATPLAGTVTSPKILAQKQLAASAKIEIEGPKIHGRGWQAPARVIDVHLPDEVEVMSADGVRSYVARLGQRIFVR